MLGIADAKWMGHRQCNSLPKESLAAAGDRPSSTAHLGMFVEELQACLQVVWSILRMSPKNSYVFPSAGLNANVKRCGGGSSRIVEHP